MAYPQGFLFQPSVSLALHSACPPLGSGLLLGPRAEEPLLGRSSSGSAFAPYSGSAAAHRPYGGEQRAAASLNSFVAPAYDPPSVDYHPFGALGSYPYGDPAYRKNATRDATATLKAWLHEHRKNPYPTKGEKIMLAIVTKMTLTQVSTWFANARRRLKKENKMTWTPRTRSEDEEDEDNAELERHGEDEDEQEAAAVDSCGVTFQEDGGDGGDGGGGEADFPHSELKEGCRSTPAPPFPQRGAGGRLSECPPEESCGAPQRTNPPPKPKLWSLAEIATSGAHRSYGPSSEGRGAGPQPAAPRHFYYAASFVPGYAGFGPGGPLSRGPGGHAHPSQQAMLQQPAEPHELQGGPADM